MIGLTGLKEKIAGRRKEAERDLHTLTTDVAEGREVDIKSAERIAAARACSLEQLLEKLEQDAESYRNRKELNERRLVAMDAHNRHLELKGQREEKEEEFARMKEPFLAEINALYELEKAAERASRDCDWCERQLRKTAPSAISDRQKELHDRNPAINKRRTYLKGRETSLEANIAQVKSDISEASADALRGKLAMNGDVDMRLRGEQASQHKPVLKQRLQDLKVELQEVTSDIAELDEQLSNISDEVVRLDELKLEVWPL